MYILNPDRALTSPQPPRAEQEEIRSENGKKESKQLQQQEVPIVGSEDDRKVADILLQDIFQNCTNCEILLNFKVADILLAAELENEMDAMAEGGDGDEDVYADDGDEEEVGEEGQVMDRSHLVGKPKRKRELKAGLLRFLI